MEAWEAKPEIWASDGTPIECTTDEHFVPIVCRTKTPLKVAPVVESAAAGSVDTFRISDGGDVQPDEDGEETISDGLARACWRSRRSCRVFAHLHKPVVEDEDESDGRSDDWSSWNLGALLRCCTSLQVHWLESAVGCARETLHRHRLS